MGVGFRGDGESRLVRGTRLCVLCSTHRSKSVSSVAISVSIHIFVGGLENLVSFCCGDVSSSFGVWGMGMHPVWLTFTPESLSYYSLPCNPDYLPKRLRLKANSVLILECLPETAAMSFLQVTRDIIWPGHGRRVRESPRFPLVRYDSRLARVPAWATSSKAE